MKTKHAFIIDPCMGNMTGHWENLCRRIYEELTARKIQTQIYGQTEHNKKLVKGLNIAKIFSLSPYQNINKINDFHIITKLFKNDFEKITHDQFQDGDLIIFPTIFPHTLKAFIDWHEKIVQHKNLKIAIIFQFPAGKEKGKNIVKKETGSFLEKFFKIKKSQNQTNDLLKKLSWQESPEIRYYQELKNILKQKPCKNFVYFASSAELANNFSFIIDQEVTALPMPAPLHSTNKPSKTEKNKIKIGYFGHASLAKGAHFLKGIVEKTNIQHCNTEFHLHINPNPDTKNILKPFYQKMDRVVCKYGHISQDELLEMINQVDIVLMPYDIKTYATTPSAIFTESVSSGKIVVIPSQSWMENEAKKSNIGHVIFEEFKENNIFLALNNAIKEITPLKKQSYIAQEKFKKLHNIKSFIDIILKESL